MLTEIQQSILNTCAINLSELTKNDLAQIIDGQKTADQLNNKQLLEFLQIANDCYRAGTNLISDQVYDFQFLVELKKRDPQHEFLHQVEPEAAFSSKTIKLPQKMLSTDKAYTLQEIEAWLKRIAKASDELELNYESQLIRVTPKLDGFAAYDDGTRLYSRGNGVKGSDISRAFARGMTVDGDHKRGHGPGEIVVSKSYFESRLSEQFVSSRNFQAAILAEKKQDPLVQKSVDDKAVVFMPFNQLPSSQVTPDELLSDFDTIVEDCKNGLDFDIDGVIFEVTEARIKQHMGATRHHHRWQIAFKENTDTAKVRVLGVNHQTSRSGRINPVAELEPTELSGATISQATAHHYQMVIDKGIGKGALIEIVRSGLVIPKIIDVLEKVEPEIPDRCPSCDTELEWRGLYLFCPNQKNCPDQIKHTIEHFFKTLGNNDGFGFKTIEKLYEKNIRTIADIYSLDIDQLVGFGFGEKTATNLVNERQRSRTEAIEDWRFLAAFGIERLGQGNCERLLQHQPLLDVFKLDAEAIANIEGFAEITGSAIARGLQAIRPSFGAVYAQDFNLQTTPLLADISLTENPVAGKIIVFTGSMTQGSRDEMKKQAKALGAKVGSAVSGKTDFLITGEKVGEKKISDARNKGVEILSEAEYLTLISNN